MKRWHILLISIAALPLVAADSCSGGTATPLTSPNTAPATSGATVTPPAPVSATFTVKGKGSRVPHITLQAVTYVVAWTAKGGTCFYGSCTGGNFIVDVVGSDGTDDNVVNELPNYKGSTGETTYTVNNAGVYLLKVDASGETWTVKFTPA